MLSPVCTNTAKPFTCCDWIVSVGRQENTAAKITSPSWVEGCQDPEHTTGRWTELLGMRKLEEIFSVCLEESMMQVFHNNKFIKWCLFALINKNGKIQYSYMLRRCNLKQSKINYSFVKGWER